jgi:hypothetical protein
MPKILSGAAIAAMVLVTWGADGTVPVKKSAAKSAVVKKKPASSTKAPTPGAPASKASAPRAPASKTTASSRRGGKKAPVSRVTWRNRQLAPTPDRYKEIQSALAAKGYLKPEDANGTWNQASADGLKRFQSEQNIESTGKINSLSLIALGLGPKHETPSVPTKTPPDPGQQPPATGQQD